MENNEKIILERKYYLIKIIGKLQVLTTKGILQWELKSLDNPFIYRTVIDTFKGPIYADYYNTSLTFNGRTFDKKNSPGAVSDMIGLLDTIRSSLDRDVVCLSDFDNLLEKFIEKQKNNEKG